MGERALTLVFRFGDLVALVHQAVKDKADDVVLFLIAPGAAPDVVIEHFLQRILDFVRLGYAGERVGV